MLIVNNFTFKRIEDESLVSRGDFFEGGLWLVPVKIHRPIEQIVASPRMAKRLDKEKWTRTVNQQFMRKMETTVRLNLGADRLGQDSGRIVDHRIRAHVNCAGNTRFQF